MPVLLEHIHEPTPADWLDFEKIHLDTAEHGLVSDPKQLQQWLNEGGWIMAGRFNDRIVGALLAKETLNESNNEIQLSQAGVRTITQRRGVMHQLLHFICHWAEQEKKHLRVSQCPLHLQAALEKRGFRQQQDDWLYTGNTL